MKQIIARDIDSGVFYEPGFDSDSYHQGIEDVLYIRCMSHREVLQFNAAANGGECASCEVERLRAALQTICDIGETRDVLIARAALGERSTSEGAGS